MKKNLFIIAGILLVIIVGLFLIFGGKSEAPTTDTTPLTGSPFGTGEEGAAGVPAQSPSYEGMVEVLPSSEEAAPVSELFKISGSPVAGFVVFPRASTTLVRYVDRATGHIFETKLPTDGAVLEKVKITNNTLPQIYEAWFRQDGSAVFMRSLDGESIKNMSATLIPPRATSTDRLSSISLTLLRGNIDSPSVGAGDTLFYVLEDSQAVVSSKFNGDTVKTLLSSAFTAWRTGRLGNGTLIFTKPSASIPGYAYSLASGGLTKLLGPLNGLSVVANPAGTWLLYSYSDGSTKMFAQEIGKSALPITPATLADKCAWGNSKKLEFVCGAPGFIDSNEPDEWYQGKTHFSDYIWRFDVLSENSELVSEPQSQYGLNLDVSLPALSPDDSYFVFVNRTDLSLWALRLR